MPRHALLVALLAALATAGLFRLYLDRLQMEVAGGPPTDVLVLTRDLSVGAVLERDALGTRPLPQAHLESRHIPAGDLVDVVGQRLSTSGKAGEALLWTDLSSMSARTRQLSTLVPEGMRAVALSLKAGRFDALLRPGDRVDVMCTRSGSPPATRVVLQNVLVLAVGRDLGAPGGSSSSRRHRGGVVTLALRVDEAKKLADAEPTGTLRLALRHPDDIVIQESGASAAAPAGAAR